MTHQLAVLISGSGTNLQAIMDAQKAGTLDAEIAVVFSNRANAAGLERAAGFGPERTAERLLAAAGLVKRQLDRSRDQRPGRRWGATPQIAHRARPVLQCPHPNVS